MMELWPFTNFHDLNLDWIIKQIKDVRTYIDNWDATLISKIDEVLSAHPEWTTTVQDGSITLPKLAQSLIDFLTNAYVTPELYGAAGDGATNDTEAIQKALDSGKTVLFRKNSTYGLYGQTPVIVPSNTNIIWNGTVKTIDPDGQSSFCFYDPITPTITPGYSGVHDVTIRGSGTFDANGRNLTESRAAPFRVHHCDGTTIEGITIKNYSENHAIEIGGSQNVTIRNVKFKGMFPNQSTTGINEAVQLEQISSGGTTGALPYDDTLTRKVTIDGCYFGPSDEGGIMRVAIASHSNLNDSTKTKMFEDIVIRNCVFENMVRNDRSGLNPLSLEGTGAVIFDSNFKNCVVENNIFRNSTTGGVKIGKYSDNIVVKNNTFESMELANVAISGDGIVNTEISGNVMNDYALYNARTGSLNAVPAVYVNAGTDPDVRISGNTFHTSTTYSTMPIHTANVSAVENTEHYRVSNNSANVCDYLTDENRSTTMDNIRRWNRGNKIRLFNGNAYSGTISFPYDIFAMFTELEIVYRGPYGPWTEIVTRDQLLANRVFVANQTRINDQSGSDMVVAQMKITFASDFKSVTIDSNSRLDVNNEGARTFRTTTTENTQFANIVKITGRTGNNNIY